VRYFVSDFAVTVIFSVVFAGGRARAQQPAVIAETPTSQAANGSAAAAPLLTPDRLSLILVNDEAVDRLRSNQLNGEVGPAPSLLIRSASTLTPSAATVDHPVVVSPIVPQFLFVSNSALPFSQNNGALWAGKGSSTRTLAGMRLESMRFRLIVAPEIVSVSNRDWVLRYPVYRAPAIPAERSGGGYVFPFYVASEWSIDQPMRFGDRPIRRMDAGQSTLMLMTKSFELGVSNENEWWGPGVRNAIVLSNNAPGFPHLFARTGRPIETRLGALEMRWLVGGLTESRYFDTDSTNNVRSIASFALALQTGWDPNLSVGLARSVYSTATGWGKVPFRLFDIFARTSRTARVASQDPAAGGVRKDHLYSLFARWVLPSAGAEIYGEWARTAAPQSIRAALIEPNDTQGYTLGMQWRKGSSLGGSFRVQAEVTSLEQSATFRDRPTNSWYMSRRVIQGYTNRGEVIGAAIGPGASSQWVAIDYVRREWRAGVFAGRIRWNEDVHSTAKLPVYVGYCSHDVSIYPGARAATSTRLGSIAADVSLQNRLNAFFQNDGGCPNIGQRLDIRNTTLSITVSPFTRW
jgi:hypothetical protein